ncbi:MAG: enoyl-CoA hydratase/isomerase family protein [Nitrospinae bacterium]|nr:enoyl-CoA hydratase/isomerase family protein [Nitrospinota bacterium]
MAYETLLYEKRARIAYVTLNRPTILNAQSPEMFDELGKVFGEIKRDPEVGVVLLTGAGDRAFCAGADINFLQALAQTNPIAAKAFVEKNRLAFGAIEHLGKPVIAAVNGYALGGGCELAMVCHIRIASENARFGQPEINLGLFPGAGGTQRLPRLVGKGIAIELMLTGEAISAQEAYRLGLVNTVVPAAELIPTAEKLAQQILAKSPLAVSVILEAVQHGMEMTLAEALQLEANLFGVICSTEDMKEGTAAFLAKRQPTFQGK